MRWDRWVPPIIAEHLIHLREMYFCYICCCIELGRSTRDRLLHEWSSWRALSTRISHFCRLTQCRDLGGQELVRGWLVNSVFYCFVGPFSVQSYSQPNPHAMCIICVWCAGDRDPAHENSTRILCRNFPCLTEFCIRCASFNGTFAPDDGLST